MMAFFGCTQAEIEESKAIIPGESEITLPLTAVEMPVSIYADGTWVADVTDEWLSIEPTSGKGCMDITLTVQANPGKETREAKIIVKGSSLMSDVEIVVKQKGDRFRDETPITVSQAVDLEKGDILKLSESQVMAVSQTGFIVSDGTSNIFVQGKSSVKMGDMVTLTGDLDSLNKIKGIVLEQVAIGGNSEIVYPDPIDITALTDYKPGKVEFVKINGTYASSGEIKVNGKSVASLFNPTDEYAILKNHTLEVNGYYVGINSKIAAVVPASYVDGGAILFPLPFVEDFSWVEPFVEQYKKNGKTMGDSMKDDKEYGIGSSYTSSNCVGFEDAFNKTGLEALFPSSKTLYVCEGNYLKMSKTANTNGLRLPAFDIAGKTDLRLTFDWGINLPDKVVLEVVLEGEGKVDGSNKFEPLPDKAGNWEWQSETVKITGADNSTRICIRPDKFTGKVVDGEKYRWFIDNIEVMSLSDAIAAVVEIDGIKNNVITFEGLQPEDVTFTVKSDADYKISANVDWLHLDVSEGLANQEQTVTVKCDGSQLSTLRQAEIVVKSGLTTKRIAVVQSAAGQSLEPFISIAGGNSITVDGLEGQIVVKVQSNVPYEWATDAEWITLAPSTKAAVTLDELIFNKTANEGAAPRVANLKFYNKEYNIQSVLTITQLPEYATLPVKWTIRSSSNFASTWPVPLKTCSVEGESGYVNSTTGFGTIWYNNASGVAADTNGKCLLDINDASPRVQGAWKGDYCQFKVPGKVNAGKKVRISFETRVSKTNPKYWLLQYYDGTDWKDACETKTAEVEGEGTVKYSHQMAKDGSTNIKVDATVTYANTTDSIIFRFICQTTMQASGSGCLSAPNGGTWRLSVTNKSDDDEWQPTIQFVD